MPRRSEGLGIKQDLAKTIEDKAYQFSRESENKRIGLTFSFCTSTRAPKYLPLVYLTDYAKSKKEIHTRTDATYAEIPLVGGGFIAFGREKDASDQEIYPGVTIMQVKIPDTASPIPPNSGEPKPMKTYPPFMVPWNWKDPLSFTEDIINGNTKEENEKEIRRFLAHFDPERDIDFSQADSFSDIQKKVVFDLGVKSLPRS